MSEIDYTTPHKVFRVATSVQHGNGDITAYMGTDILVNANTAAEAEQAARRLGHTPNRCFPPVEVKER